eukprot:gnl/Dysnectes_brevis/7650_a13034_408.p1 GENE.gnl/Dysnectes_brevis/7650_a13034_408~~gnl/Dysnectes_brevis/7650_a13034_408.p1  ORF type:complete len:206 (+),score=14.67 gnl/Dysnectes_brevis/7650_a13034_408:73-690(+)
MASKNPDLTLYVGDLDPQVDEFILYELFLQGGPIVSVNMPRDPLTGLHRGFGFVELPTAEDAQYCMKLFHNIQLFDKNIKVKPTTAAKEGATKDIGAKLWIGNLSDEVDEQKLHDTFGSFGVLVSLPQIVYDEDGKSKGHAHLSYSTFDAADRAKAALNQQYFCGRMIRVEYMRKEGATDLDERHGSSAERKLASSKALHQLSGQ